MVKGALWLYLEQMKKLRLLWQKNALWQWQWRQWEWVSNYCTSFSVLESAKKWSKRQVWIDLPAGRQQLWTNRSTVCQHDWKTINKSITCTFNTERLSGFCFSVCPLALALTGQSCATTVCFAPAVFHQASLAARKVVLLSLAFDKWWEIEGALL